MQIFDKRMHQLCVAEVSCNNHRIFPKAVCRLEHLFEAYDILVL